MKLIWLAGTMIAAACLPQARAEIKTQKVQYEQAGAQLEGMLAWDDSISGRRPGVLVVHEWWGLNDYARSRARQLAEMGYVAFALDMYGKGKVTEHPQEAGEWAGRIRANQENWQKRALAGYEILRNHELVDPSQTAAIGYCFGGSTVLQLAYSGTDLKAVVSFHGALPTPTEEQAEQIKARILVCHGAADGFISEESIQAFRQGLEKANVDWEMIYYAGARHSFTNKGADERGIDGLRYNAKADRRSWRQMKILFDDVFADS